MAVMNERKKILLNETVSHYIKTAEPVGSKVLSEKEKISVSSATIRHELSELEKEGYLTQTHTSSGRIPTDKGYRFFVDQIKDQSALTPFQKSQLGTEIATVGQNIESALVQVSEILYSLIDYTTIVITPDIYHETLKVAHLILVDIDKVLVILLNSVGINSEFLLTLTEKYDQEDLNKAAQLLTTKLSGKSIYSMTQENLSELKMGLPKLNSLLDSLGEAIVSLTKSNRNDKRLVTKGLGKMLKLPEFRDIELTQRVMTTLEESKVLTTILSEYMATNDCQVLIGQENRVEALQECSLVLSPCAVGKETVGLVGVLGPKRMAYPTIVPMVQSITKMVGEHLSKKSSQKETSNGK